MNKPPADYGADVIKIEPPGGDFARKLGPFRDDTPDPEASGTFLYFNTNKRSLVLDLERRKLPEYSTGWSSAPMSWWKAIGRVASGSVLAGNGYTDCARDISLSISNFGQESPYRDYLGTELTLYGFAGEMYTMGVAEREPVKMFGTAALVESGAAAAGAIMSSLFVTRRQGIGQHVDFSITDSQFGGADRRHVSATAFAFSGRRTTRTPIDARGILRGVYPCADGTRSCHGAATGWTGSARKPGNPEWLADPKWQEPGALLDPGNGEEFEGNFYPWLMAHTKQEIWEKAREARVLCGPLMTVDELVNDRHFRERGFWEMWNTPWPGHSRCQGAPS
ncbi:MAG: CoA transferase [Dehalococcoidia bacterium]|nr:CoA transferase [Dehalococcoidia bacterium]